MSDAMRNFGFASQDPLSVRATYDSIDVPGREIKLGGNTYSVDRYNTMFRLAGTSAMYLVSHVIRALVLGYEIKV